MRSTRDLLARLEAIDATKVEATPFELAKAAKLLPGLSEAKQSVEFKILAAPRTGPAHSARRAADIIGEIDKDVGLDSEDSAML